MVNIRRINQTFEPQIHFAELRCVTVASAKLETKQQTDVTVVAGISRSLDVDDGLSPSGREIASMNS